VRLWGRRALVLTTTGRRSGLPRTVVVQFFPDGEDLVVVAANSGLPTHPAWYLNLTADPRARVEVEGRTLEVRAEELTPDEAAEQWPGVLAIAPDYARYRARTDRVIPLVRLVPVPASPPSPG
jgi:deazaflavin-dependent oxidoreductase (nitroreductase family)